MKTTNPVVRPFDEGALRRSYRRRLYGFVFSQYERVLTLSEAERETLSLMYPDQSAKFEVVTNPYVTPEMLAVDEHEHSPGRSNLLTLARLMPQKRLDVLLAAFARLPHKHARLTIVGEGPERPRLQALARSLGIADRIEMPGFAEDVMPWLRRADLFVLSSDYEGLPAALIEALACNIPVVTTDCFDGARSLLAGASGCAVVRRDDVDALAEAIAVSLTETRPLTGLREIARAYGVEAGIASHIAALRPLLRSREADATSS
jgi:glycosyltransferase involved in cell wall biosynthesis